MTERHFIAIAAILRHRIEEAGSHHGVLEAAAEDLADYFATVNSRFDRARFLRACRGEA